MRKNPEGHVKIVEILLMRKKLTKNHADPVQKNLYRLICIYGLLSFFLVCFTLSFSTAQIRTDSLDQRLKMEVHLIRDGRIDQTISPIRSVHYIDVRDDSSSLGYSFKSGNKHPYILTTREPLTKTLENWTRFYLGADETNQQGYDLHIFIRKLRLSADFSQLLASSKDSIFHFIEQPTGVQIKADIYIKQDSFYYPVKRYDSILSGDKMLSQNAHVTLTFIMERMCQKIAETNLARCLFNKKRSRSETDQYYTAKQHYPIFREEPQMGVYRNFEEFLNNRPHFMDFHIGNGKIKDSIYYVRNNERIKLKNMWGCSDGFNLYICSGGKISTLVRVNHTFYFKGIVAPFRENTSDFTIADLFPGKKNKNQLTESSSIKLIYRYLQVDMENGYVY